MNRGMRNSLLASMAVIALAAGCAKSEKTEPNEASKRYFDAWIQIKHPDVTPTELGVYIIDDQEGSGEQYEEQAYVYVKYTVSSLDGTITSTSYDEVAKRIGSYNKANYYGSHVWIMAEGMIAAGVQDMINGMKVGGKRTAVIPTWLMTTDRYSKPSDYLKHSSDNDNSIYTVELVGFTDDIVKSEVDSCEVFAEKYLDGLDSLSYGFYYKQLEEPADDKEFPSDTSIYINYTGRLLNGQVFDTTVEDTAKFYNIYSSSSTYEPVQITWGENWSDITMGSSDGSSSSLISGFQKTLWEMKRYEKGVGMFISPYGYGYSGSGNRIPSFAPLLFEIEIVDEP
ncbi:MAG: FKBP-type peptidyl-prolyl cis-trans isomerase [Bacteroidales bacterium]|nr:FKBP-type peptidyl-prolyl cis-trans isomerase [Bacteroidales bacterium]